MATDSTQPLDEYGKELQDRLAATEGLLKAHKFAHAQALRDGQQEDGEGPTVADLEKIGKLERQVSNMKSFIRCRELTRDPQ